MIEIANNGDELLHTNYWATPAGRAGYVYASWNAGALRLLMPTSTHEHLAEMRLGSHAVVTRGMFQGVDALEIMFDDGSDAPFALHLAQAQSDRTLPAEDHGKSIVVALWGEQGKLHEVPGVYRVGGTLPDMTPWVSQ